MISKDIIMAALIGVAITGIIPLVSVIVLLAIGKLKGTSFWAGVLTFVIAFVAYAIIGSIASASIMLSSGDVESMMSGNIVIPPVVSVVLTFIMAIFFALSMGICIGSCMKNTRTFKGAVSCGAGFGISFSAAQAVSFFSSYNTFAQINSGEFDKNYAKFVEMGAMDKATVAMLKETYTKFTVSDIVIQIISSLAALMLMIAAAVFIMRGACSKKLFAGICVSVLLMAAQFGLPSILTDAAVASMVITTAIGIAALIFAVRMKEKVVPPTKTEYTDSFIQSVESAKNDTSGTAQQ